MFLSLIEIEVKFFDNNNKNHKNIKMASQCTACDLSFFCHLINTFHLHRLLLSIFCISLRISNSSFLLKSWIHPLAFYFHISHKEKWSIMFFFKQPFSSYPCTFTISVFYLYRGIYHLINFKKRFFLKNLPPDWSPKKNMCTFHGMTCRDDDVSSILISVPNRSTLDSIVRRVFVLLWL